MAGDWIKMGHDLSQKPEVVALAARLGMDRFAIVGRLHEIWCWFDRHTSDGNARGVTQAFLDSLVDAEGFASALASVGWLDAREGAIRMPNFSRHLSKSAKQRALGQERSQRFRNAATVTKPSPEKRREEKRKRESDAPFPLPLELDTAAFRDVWSQWHAHRLEKKKPLTPTSVRQQLKMLAGKGVERAIAIVEYTIAMGWEGLREPEQAHRPEPPKPPPAPPANAPPPPRRLTPVNFKHDPYTATTTSKPPSPAQSVQATAAGQNGAGQHPGAEGLDGADRGVV